MTAQPRSSQPIVAPPTLEVFYSRGIAVLMILAPLIFGGYALYMLFALAHTFLLWPIALLLGAALIPMLCLPIIAGLRALRWEGPVLILDEDGITDHRKRNAFVPWKDIGEVNMNRPLGEMLLSVEFNDAEIARKYVRNPLLLNSIVRYLWFWGHRNHSITLLKCRPIELIDTARALRQHSIRVRVREANRRRDAQAANAGERHRPVARPPHSV